jgi:phage terminase small subunit
MAPTPPVALTGPAADFWKRHAERLWDAGILTDADLDSFTICCHAFAKVQELQALDAGEGNYRGMVQLVNFMKQFHSYAQQFGLMPKARKQARLSIDAPKAKDEFGLS